MMAKVVLSAPFVELEVDEASRPKGSFPWIKWETRAVRAADCCVNGFVL